MKDLDRLFEVYFLPLIITLVCTLLVKLIIEPIFPVYYLVYYTEISVSIVLFVIFLGLYCWYRERLKDFHKNFQVYKQVESLKPSDLGVHTYYPFYLHRESDDEIEKSLNLNNFAFITGMPNIGKTRGAYQVITEKLNGWYLLKPTYEKIEVQSLRLPLFRKKTVLFLDDLEKYVLKFSLDELVEALKKGCKELKVIATCRTGKEFDEVFGQKEMAKLLSECQRNKVEPRKLEKKEQEKLAEGIGKKLQEVKSDGTPGSIVLGLGQMKKRYVDLKDEPKTILKLLKLLKEANIFSWNEKLIRSIAKGKIFELEGKSYEWDSWLKTLQESSFIERSNNEILISHDSYLDDAFINDFRISDSILHELKEELSSLRDVENLLYLGNSFYHRKNPEEAVDCYEKSVQINPNIAVSHYNLGNLFYDFERYTEAEREYKEAIRISPEDTEAHVSLGNLLKEERRYNEAEKEYKEALRINSDLAIAHNALGILYRYLKNYPEAEKEYREALRSNPFDAKNHIKLGNSLKQSGNYPEAEKEYREAIRIKPDHYLAHNDLGYVLKQMGRYPEAEEEYRKAIRINPNHYMPHNYLGIILFILKKYPEAEKEFREAIKLNPASIEAHSNLVNLLEHMRRCHEVEKEHRRDKSVRIRKTISLLIGILLIITGLLLFWLAPGKKEPNSKTSLSTVLESSSKKPPETEKGLIEATRDDPYAVGYHLILANLFLDSLKYSDAEKELRKAITINPNLDNAHNKLGLLLQELRRYSEAETELKDAIRIKPYDAKYRNDLGDLLYFLKRNSEAVKQYKEAIRINPYYIKVYENLCILLKKMGRKEEAKDLLLIAKKLFESERKEEAVNKIKYLLKGLENE